jgi:hypothetical protein
MTLPDLDNSEKLISALAGLVTIFGAFFAWKKWRTGPGSPGGSNQNITYSTGQAPTALPSQLPTVVIGSNIATLKATTRVLFIDDDSTFKIVGILKRMGWDKTRVIKDVKSIDDDAILNADILFVDIQGVGRKMQLKDEGLGLALAIKTRFPEKKVIIYSAQEVGQRFHEALQEADYSLPKNADPIRFEETILRVLKQ